MPRRVRESGVVIDAIASQTGFPAGVVETYVDAFRDAVDELIADDYSIVAPPLFYVLSGDPVFEALAKRAKHGGGVDFEAWCDWSDERIADWLGVTVDRWHRHPVATLDTVFDCVLDRFGMPEEDPHGWPPAVKAKAERIAKVLDAWIGSFSEGRAYEVGPAGLERDFENWLEDHMAVLGELGWPVSLHARQVRVAGGRFILDMLCRFTADAGRSRQGDWLVIENKATIAYPEAGDQLVRYMTQVETELAGPGENVSGLLIADGICADVWAHLDALGVKYVSLTALGYRRRSWPKPPGTLTA